MPHTSHVGWVKVGTAPPMPNGVATTAATSIAAPSWSMPLIAPLAPSLLLPSGLVLAILWPRIT